MTLSPDVQFLEDLRLLVYRPRGVLNEGAVNQITTTIGELESSMKEPFDRFFDALALEEIELNFRHMIQISLYRRMYYSGRPPVKSAILANNKTLIHYAELHAILTQGSPITVRIFGAREAAAKWLNVPLSRLLPNQAEPKSDC